MNLSIDGLIEMAFAHPEPLGIALAWAARELVGWGRKRRREAIDERKALADAALAEAEARKLDVEADAVVSGEYRALISSSGTQLDRALERLANLEARLFRAEDSAAKSERAHASCSEELARARADRARDSARIEHLEGVIAVLADRIPDPAASPVPR